MSPFSIERRGTDGSVSSYSLQEGEFLLSIEPEVWINFSGSNRATLEFPQGIEKGGRCEPKKSIILNKGAAVCDLAREEEVFIDWQPSIQEKIKEREHLRYRPISGRLMNRVYASGIHPERCRRGVFSKALEHGRCYSRQLVLATGALVVDILIEPIYRFPLRVYDEAVRRENKIRGLLEQETEIKKAA